MGVGANGVPNTKRERGRYEGEEEEEYLFVFGTLQKSQEKRCRHRNLRVEEDNGEGMKPPLPCGEALTTLRKLLISLGANVA